MSQTSNAGDTPQALITFHGTLVHYDAGARCLRHAAIGACQANVFVVRRGTDVVLVARDGDQVRTLGRHGPDLRTLAFDDDPGVLTLVPAGQDLVSLRAEGGFLRAERGGAMDFSRPDALDWERFLPIGLDDLANLEFVLSNRWFSALSGAVFEPESDPGVGRHRVQFGSGRYRIEDIAGAARSGSGMPRELLLMSEGWKSERYILFRPLTYLAAYGSEEIFRCAELAIGSLFEFGAWNGDVLVMTGLANAGFAQRLPDTIRERIHVVPIPADDVLDYTLARYRIADLALADMYQPVIYIDTDVVCDAPLPPLARLIALSHDLQVAPEFSLGTPSPYYGQPLMTADGMAIDASQRGLSSCIFAFRDIKEQRRLFHTIIETAYSVAKSAGRRDPFECYDQPFFNYVLRKTRLGNPTLFENAVMVHHNHLPVLTTPVRKGFVHFAGGVGNAAPKLTQMMSYIDTLRRDPAGQAGPVTP